jgi:hypothetical protein
LNNVAYEVIWCKMFYFGPHESQEKRSSGHPYHFTVILMMVCSLLFDRQVAAAVWTRQQWRPTPSNRSLQLWRSSPFALFFLMLVVPTGPFTIKPLFAVLRCESLLALEEVWDCGDRILPLLFFFCLIQFICIFKELFV